MPRRGRIPVSAAATRDLEPAVGPLKITCKSLQVRAGAYFLVDDSGHAWKFQAIV
jgi:hypothetical protein